VVGGSTNKLTAAGFDRADKKASTFKAAEFSLVGNNSTGAKCLVELKKSSLLLSDCQNLSKQFRPDLDQSKPGLNLV
jgi:hypothetical protein